MENETFKIPEIITVDWLRETINELNNKLEIIINSDNELSRLLAEKQITYEVYREKIDNHSKEMQYRDLRSKIETFERVLEAFAYDRIMQDPEAIDKLYQGYKENLERSLSEQKTKKEELEQELSMLENELTMSKYVSGSTENLKIVDSYQKGKFYITQKHMLGRDYFVRLKEVAKQLCKESAYFDPISFFDDIIAFYDSHNFNMVGSAEYSSDVNAELGSYSSMKLYKGMTAWDFSNCCERALANAEVQDAFDNSNLAKQIQSAKEYNPADLYIYSNQIYKKTDIINLFKEKINGSNMNFSIDFDNISNLQISFMVSMIQYNTHGLNYLIKPIMNLSNSYFPTIESSTKDLKASINDIDKNIKYMEEEQLRLTNNDKKSYVSGRLGGFKLDSSIKPVSEDSKIILEQINSLVKKLSVTNNRIQSANNQIDSYGKEIVDLHLEFMEKGFSYDGVRHIYQNNIETENKIKEQVQKITDLEKEIEKIKLDINGCEDEKKNKESEKVDTEQKKESIEYFNPKKNKSVDGKIGRFFFRLFNKKQYLANQESYTKKMNDYNEQIKSLESKINGLKNNMDYKKRDISLAENEKNNLKLNIRTGEIRQNGATVTVDQIMSYCTHYSSNLVHNIEIKKSSTEEYNQIISDIRKKVLELKAIPNLTEDTMEFASQLQNQIDSGEINYNSEFNIQSLDSSIQYDEYLRREYKHLSPELFDKLYRGEYTSEMSLNDAEDTLTGSGIKK